MNEDRSNDQKNMSAVKRMIACAKREGLLTQKLFDPDERYVIETEKAYRIKKSFSEPNLASVHKDNFCLAAALADESAQFSQNSSSDKHVQTVFVSASETVEQCLDLSLTMRSQRTRDFYRKELIAAGLSGFAGESN